MYYITIVDDDDDDDASHRLHFVTFSPGLGSAAAASDTFSSLLVSSSVDASGAWKSHEDLPVLGEALPTDARSLFEVANPGYSVEHLINKSIYIIYII